MPTVNAAAPTWIGRLLAFLFGCALLLLIAEVGLRLVYPRWQEFASSRFIVAVPVPNHGTVAIGRPGFDGYFAQNNGDFRVRISINEFGLRNQDPIAAAGGRLWTVGDSMTFGWGVEQSETFSAVIHKTTGIPTYNVASPGSDVCGYQALVARIPQEIRPRAVVVGLVLENDLNERVCGGRAGRAEVAPPPAVEPPQPKIMAVKVFLTIHSSLYNFFAVAVKRVGFIEPFLVAAGFVKKEHAYKNAFDPSRIEPTVEAVGTQLSDLKDMFPSGIPFAVLIVPSRFEIRDNHDLSRKMRLAVVEHLTKRGIDVIDPSEGFRTAGFVPTHFHHDGHWSPLGHGIAAKYVAGWLKSALHSASTPATKPN